MREERQWVREHSGARNGREERERERETTLWCLEKEREREGVVAVLNVSTLISFRLSILFFLRVKKDARIMMAVHVFLKDDARSQVQPAQAFMLTLLSITS